MSALATSDKSRPPLLDAFLALKPNAIYTMGKPKEITSAASAFVQGAVESFQWGASGQLLEARMSGEGRPAILFTCENGKLRTSAQPEHAHTSRLVLPAIMTIMRILLEAKFHRDDLPPAILEKFRRQLKAPRREAQRPRVILTGGLPGEPFDLDFDSGSRESSWRVTGPDPGMEWLDWQQREPDRVGEAFCRWLDQKPENVDVELRLRGASRLLPNPSTASLSGRIHLGLREGQVTVARTVVNERGRPIGEFIDLGYGLVLVPEQNLFILVQPRGAWREFAKFGSTQPGDRSLRFPFASFLQPYSTAVSDSCVLLDEAGSSVEAFACESRPLVRAVTDGHTVRVSLRAGSGNGGFPPAHQLLARSFETLFLDGPFALLVKMPGRRRRLSERLGQLAILEDPERIEEVLLETAGDPAFISRAMHGDDAVNGLRFLLAGLRELDENHLAANPAGSPAPWLCCTGSGRALGLALAAFVRAFPGEDPLRAKDLVLEIEALRFFENLSGLVAACRDLDVDLKVDEMETGTEKMEFSVRVLRGGGTDWFELHPEARAGALAIPRGQWEQVLRSGHFFDGNDRLVAFDPGSLAMLRRFSGLVEGKDGDSPIRLPRLGIFDWLALRQEGICCELPGEDGAVLESLANLESLPSHPLPSGLCVQMREYQRHGYDWLCFLYRHRFGACLADDMGLGKTLQAIALLAAIQDGTLPRQSARNPATHLVVLPSTLLFNWQSEIQKFAPALKIHEYTGQERTLDFSGADLVMTTYGLMQRDIEALSGVEFDIAVFDEAQAIKNASAGRTRAAARINARFRLCLTGTPLENHIGEFHSIMETAVPGLFGDRREFLRSQEPGLSAFHRVRPFLLRRTKEKILAELPAKVESDASFALSEPQRECYTRTVGEVRREVLAAYEDRPRQQAGIVALAALLRLRQICISPALLSDQFDSGSPKIDYLVEKLRELAEEGHAALVFSQFLKALDLTGAALEKAGLPFQRMDGSTPTARRKALVEDFQSGTSPGIFLISLKTGGTGLNLTRASYVYHLDPWWNPAVENQASDRVHRIGQKNSVFVQRLIMRHTVEEKMMALKQQKQALFAAALDQSQPASPEGAASLTAADFQFLLES